MKTFNTKLIVALITTLVLTGCMPDSLTKFKKDEPTKAPAIIQPGVVDSNGNAVDPNSLVYPSKFYFVSEGSIPTVDLSVGVAADLVPIVDGSMEDSALRKILFVKCQLVTDTGAGTTTTTLPPGLGLNQSDCKIVGTPTKIHTNNGAPIQYTVQMYYKGSGYTGAGTESLIKAHIKIGVYQTPTNLAMTQTDKLQIVLTANGGTFANIISNTDSSLTYDRYGVLTSSNGISGVVKYTDSSTGTVGVNRSQAIAVDSVASVGVNEFIVSSVATGSKRGKIVSVNTTTKTIHIEPLLSTTVFAPNDPIDFVATNIAAYTTNDATILQPLTVSDVTSFTAGSYLTTAGGTKRGRVERLDSSAKVLFVKILSPNVAFAENDQIDAVASSVAPFVSTKSAVSSVTTIFSFKDGEKLDNDKQYFSDNFTIAKITQIFPTDTAIEIAPLSSPTLSSANGIKYTIFPLLPDGLSLDTSTGKITGTFTSTMNSTAFTITATNSLGSTNVVIYIAAINAPEDLSYTTRQLIAVTSNTSFYEGETLFQPVAPPEKDSVVAKILRKVSTNKLSIDTINGNFLAQASLDSGNVFSSIKTSITIGSLPNNYNIALTLDGAVDMTLFPKGSYVSTAAGAKGIIVEADTPSRVIYIRFLTPSIASSNPLSVVPASITTFTEGASIDNAYPYVAAAATIDEVEASNMVLTLTPSAAAFTAGHDITSSAYHSGYIYEQSGNVIKVDEINRTGALGVQAPGSVYLRRLQTVANSEYYTGPMQTIQAVSHDNLLVIERGVPRTIYANVSQGTSLNYTISPALPAGLAIDAKTGIISGAAQYMSPRTTYVVTATNLLGSTYYALDIEVRDYFTFADTSGAKSFLTHKVGDYKTHRACRINAKDIIEGNTSALDIGCNLEAEEMDLYYTTLKLSAMVGAGTCEYVTFTPYAFWQYAPITTKRKVDVVSDCSGPPAGAIGDLPTPEDYCLGNYANVDGPNCDTGAITAVVWSGVTAGAACTIQTPQTIQCGGKKSACLAGPITSVLTNPEDIENGSRGVFIESSAGMTKEWSIDSSYKNLDATNLRNANHIVSNQCTDTRADASKWADLQYSIQSTKTPFGGESPFYEFNCLDAAQDVKARIRLTIRDWDRSFRIKDNITDLIPTSGLMNAIGTTPLGVSWNNNYDWDNSYSSIYPLDAVQATSCGALPAGTCSTAGPATINACKAIGATWNDPGVCSRATHVTRRACETAGETWIPVTEGTCSVVPATNTTKDLCSGAGGIWTLREFPFPGDDI